MIFIRLAGFFFAFIQITLALRLMLPFVEVPEGLTKYVPSLLDITDLWLAPVIAVTERFEMETQPQLLLLQKTMLVTEGVGRQLDPSVNMWNLARGPVEQWMVHNRGPIARAREVAGSLARMSERLPALGGKAMIGALLAPDDRGQGILNVGHKPLLFLGLGPCAPIPAEQGVHQVRPLDPLPVRIAAQVGHAHIPIGELEVDDALPGAPGHQPVGRAVVPVTGAWAFTGKGRKKPTGRVGDCQFIV